MTTTLTPNTIPYAIRLFAFCLVFSLITRTAIAQSRIQEESKVSAGTVASTSDFETYVFQISQVRNRAEAKEFAEQARGLFDCVPNYSERTGLFSFKARFAFDEKDIVEKLTGLGYQVIYFKPTKGDD